jgi:hypothetical protein
MIVRHYIREEYGGVRFRSRAEAQWAKFFTVARLPWHYEPHQYRLPHATRYTPDFWLGTLGVFFEVKTTYPKPREEFKARELAAASLRPVVLSYSTHPKFHDRRGRGADQDNAIRYEPDRSETATWWWRACDECDAVGIYCGGEGACLKCGLPIEYVNRETHSWGAVYLVALLRAAKYLGHMSIEEAQEYAHESAVADFEC